MSVEERDRIALFEALKESIGSEHAVTFMELVPPTGWGDVARTSDLAAQTELLRGEIAQLGSALRGEAAQTEGNLRADMATMEGNLRSDMAGIRGDMATLEGNLRGELATMLRTMLITYVSSTLVLVGLILQRT